MKYIRAYIIQNPDIFHPLNKINSHFALNYWSVDELKPHRIVIPSRQFGQMCNHGIFERRRFSREEIAAGRLRTRKKAWKYYRLTEKAQRFLKKNGGIEV